MSEKAKPLTAEEEAALRFEAAEETPVIGSDEALGLFATLDAARERIAELEAALTFYADEANWRTRGHPQIDAHDTAINFDRGARARNAIRPQPWCTDPVACRAAGRCPHDPVCGN